MDTKKWLIVFFIEMLLFFTLISLVVIFVDPYFHYHKPVKRMFYALNNQRSQNDGIIKTFDYNAIITGTSMAENFKTSEFDKLFDVKSIKVCFSGGSYKEINDNLKKAFDSGHDVKYVLRCLDYTMILTDKDKMRYDLGEYPTYLYDNNPFNDVKYTMNKEIIFNICIPMITRSYFYGEAGGITSFDQYSNWSVLGAGGGVGAKNVLGDRREYTKAEKNVSFTDWDYKVVKENLEQNVISLAKEYPETIFYYYFSPYSIAYWGELYEEGTLEKQIKAEKAAIEQILQYENIRLYSFHDCWELTTNLDNYKDARHYEEWINTKILYMIHDGRGHLTKDNYEEYINRIQEFYSGYNYRFN